MNKKSTSNWADASVKELNLSTRAFNAVTRGAKIKTVGELAAKSDDDLCWCPGFGPTTLRECRTAIRQFLTERGQMGDVASALRRSINEAGADLTPGQAIFAINNLANSGWELRRI